MTLADVLAALLQATRILSVALLLILAMRPLARRMLGANACYALWWLLPAALIAAIVPPWPAAGVVPGLALEYARAAAPRAVAETAAHAVGLPMAGWLAGAAAMAWLLRRQQRVYERSLGVIRRRGPAWISEHADQPPAVMGVFRPRLVLPRNFRTRYTRAERRLILAHERTHIRRGDLPANAAMALLRCLFWFHPLVHLAAARMRLDQELACDALVVARHPHSRRTYGEAMLKTLAHARPAPLGAQWGIRHPIKERIHMLTQPVPRRSRRFFGAVLVGALCSTTVFAAWAMGNSSVDAQDSYTARVSLDFANGAHKELALRNTLGKPFTIKSDEGGMPFALQGTVTRTADGHYDLRAEIREADAVAATPHLVASADKVARIRIGDQDAAGRFEGTTVSITFSAP